MMINRYSVNGLPRIKQIINASELPSLVSKDGFLIIQVDAENDDELYDYVEEFGAFSRQHGVWIIVTNKDITVSEVIKKVDKMKEAAKENEDE